MKDKLGDTTKYDPETANDQCPVCKQHPSDLGYKFFSSGTLAMFCCETCGVVYVPKSIQRAMEELKEKSDKRIVVPNLVGVGPGMKN